MVEVKHGIYHGFAQGSRTSSFDYDLRRRSFLLQKRKDNGQWGYPGGSLELGDSFESCAKREVLEETGLHCQELIHYMNVSGESMHYTYPNGDEIYAAESIYLCHKYTGELCMQEDEVLELRFFDLDNLPENITQNNFPAIDRFRRENENLQRG